MMSDRNPAAQVEIGLDGTMQWATVYRSGMLYNHLTCVHTNVLGLNQPPAPAPPAPPHGPTTHSMAWLRMPPYHLSPGQDEWFRLWPTMPPSMRDTTHVQHDPCDYCGYPQLCQARQADMSDSSPGAG
ncbi:hypothetical protein DYB28_007476 [Aphanomyces astaci]|uniref:Uncharacterized protein n=1 Tax=Aphanomyces astaci TaxID=112090 RepID=A0A9X8DPS8_APHAT|nr:hypothetical protein DYB28_007476 [Aphanomyces astaci]